MFEKRKFRNSWDQLGSIDRRQKDFFWCSTFLKQKTILFRNYIMRKSIALLQKGFESSSGTTPEFMVFYRTFKKELTVELLKRGCTNIQINKGHFYCSGFFTYPSGQVYYFSIPDVRDFNESLNRDGSMLYRTAKDYKDFRGGHNQYVRFESDMIENMKLV